MAAAEAGPRRFGLSGPDRAALYRLAAITGLRASELASLTPASLDLNGPDGPTVTVAAAHSEHRRRDVQPLHPESAAQLRAWVETKLDAGLGRDEPLRPGRWAEDRKVAPMLRGDMEAAGVAYEDATGRVLDFHALRHTFVTNVAATGANVRDVQAVARHLSVTLMMDRYAHPELRDADAAVGRLAPPPPPDVGRVRATGTDARDADPRDAARPGRGPDRRGSVALPVARAGGNTRGRTGTLGGTSTTERPAAGGRGGVPAGAVNAAPHAWGAAKRGAGVSERRPAGEGWYTGLEPATSGITIR